LPPLLFFVLAAATVHSSVTPKGTAPSAPQIY